MHAWPGSKVVAETVVPFGSGLSYPPMPTAMIPWIFIQLKPGPRKRSSPRLFGSIFLPSAQQPALFYLDHEAIVHELFGGQLLALIQRNDQVDQRLDFLRFHSGI